jgi:hypothetical protein
MKYFCIDKSLFFEKISYYYQYNIYVLEKGEYMSKKNIDIHEILDNDETIIWEGKPDRKAYFANRIIGGGILPFFWTFVGLYLIYVYNSLNIPIFATKTIIIMFLIWNIPVWFWIYKSIITGLAQENTYYIITDKGIYLKNGTQEVEVFVTENERFDYKDIVSMKLHVGIIDRFFSVGDVYFVFNHNGKNKKYYIVDVKNIQDVYSIIEQHNNNA